MLVNKFGSITSKKMKYLTRVTFIIFMLSITNIFVIYAQETESIQLAQQYDDKGETEKAKSLYEDLSKKKKNIPIIHNRYFRLLVNNGFIKEADDYVSRALKYFPDNVIYRIDQAIVEDRKGNKEKAKNLYAEVINTVVYDPYKLSVVANHFLNNELIEEAILAFQKGREASDDPGSYALELANVYRRLNEKDKMVEEYLTYAKQDEGRIAYVKNVLQSILTEENDLDDLATLLLDKIQNNPDEQLYGELLIWVNMQQKNFYGAFMQARAIDRRNRTEGDWTMEVAGIALENQDYENALKMYEYVIDKYPGTQNYILARRLKIKAREELVKNKYPVAEEDILKLVEDYQNYINESANTPIGQSASVLEAKRSQALLYAFYMGKMEEAIAILEEVANSPKASRELKAQCKLDMGDIYILIDEPWESTLLYSQVEKAHKEEPIGYEAKLRNAKLSYYKGDFELAQSHLDVLKLATSREIANDAMSLSLLIQNNTAFDTTEAAMKAYAKTELLLFQNKQEQALEKLDSMLTKYEKHPLEDEIYWLMAQVDMKMGKFDEALAQLERITKNYPQDILGDDAMYLTAKIYEEQLQDKDKAMKVYTQFLKDYPGSIYVADVRKRFRMLRGDFNAN